MARSKWKAPYIKSSLIYKINGMRSHTTFVYIKERSSVILPHFVGMVFKIYTGREYIRRNVTQEIVGYKLGEFSWTRKHGQIHRKRYRVIKKNHFHKYKNMKFKEKKAKLANVKKKKNKKAWHAKKTK